MPSLHPALTYKVAVKIMKAMGEGGHAPFCENCRDNILPALKKTVPGVAWDMAWEEARKAS